MQTRYVLFFAIIPIVLEGCCELQRNKEKTVELKTTRMYRAVEGETFRMPCLERPNGEVVWSSGRELFFHLQVLERSSLGCTGPEEGIKDLISGTGGEITCPGFNCCDQASNTDVIWYKGNTAISELQKDNRRAIRQEKGRLLLVTVYGHDTAVFFCERHTSEQGVVWTNTRAVNVTVIGQSYNLTCEVKFGFQKHFSPVIQWYTYNHGKNEDIVLIQEQSQIREKRSSSVVTDFLVTNRAVIPEVTLLHLDHTYTCFASNSVGNSSATIKLKRKNRVKWLEMVVCPIVPLLLVTGLGIILRVKWLEVSLIYRSRYQHANNGEVEKDFDVFLSCIWSPLSREQMGGFTLCPSSGSKEEDRLKTEEWCDTQEPLEVLLPRVLEDQWSYRLCLLERDLLPGGAYTDDVVHTLQRSRMLICLLSADFLSNSNAVFVLESGIRALLQDSHLKLLLIWTRGTPALVEQLDPPLPSVVRRALKVLPTLDWTSSKAARATNSFWRSLRKAMPVQR
ncbi:interleukin-18 receptor accessory protein-like [Diretmus argenteus]